MENKWVPCPTILLSIPPKKVKMSAVYSHNAARCPQKRPENASREAFTSSPECLTSALGGRGGGGEGSVSLSEELPFTNTNTCSLRKPLSICYLQPSEPPPWNTARVSQHLHRWRSEPVKHFFSFVFFFPLAGTLSFLFFPSSWRNEERAVSPNHWGACHSAESCHKDALQPKRKNGPG